MITPDLNSYKWVQSSINDSTPLSTRESLIVNRVAKEDFCFRGRSYSYPEIIIMEVLLGLLNITL